MCVLWSVDCLAGKIRHKIIATVAVRPFMVSSSFNPLNKVLFVVVAVVGIVVASNMRTCMFAAAAAIAFCYFTLS